MASADRLMVLNQSRIGCSSTHCTCTMYIRRVIYSFIEQALTYGRLRVDERSVLCSQIENNKELNRDDSSPLDQTQKRRYSTVPPTPTPANEKCFFNFYSIAAVLWCRVVLCCVAWMIDSPFLFFHHHRHRGMMERKKKEENWRG